MQFFRFRELFWTLLMGAMFAVLFASTVWAGETTYVVKRNDTLYGIASEHGISVARLAERNELSKNYHVRVGERLIIPEIGGSSSSIETRTITVQRGDTLIGLAGKYKVSVKELAGFNGISAKQLVRVGERLTIPPAHPAGKAVTASVALPKSVAEAIQNAPVRKGRWKYIVIHHSGVDEGTVKGMDRYHREVRHMENGLAYHFVIGNGNGMGDGEIAACHRWREQLDGGHLASLSQNKVALGICLVGNFDKHAPSSRQLRSLTALVKTLMKRCDLSTSAVKTHQQINIIGTRCPGKKFPAKSFVAGLK